MKIGNIQLDNNLVLSPMAGITDKTYRYLAKRMGAGLVVTEMVSAKGLHYGDKKTKKYMEIREEERPVSIQIFGSDPEIIGRVIREHINIRDDIDIIDINMGCPAPKIVKNNDGSALMKDLDLVKRILNTMVESSDKPVTVKTRVGWDDNSKNGLEIAKIAQYEGVDAITIHGRTREMFYTGEADWDYIKHVKDEVKIPVIGNGDIFEAEDAKKMIEHTKCDGVAIGRGAMGNPWIFREILEFRERGSITKPSNEEIIETVILHLDMICEDKGEYIGVKEMRKHIHWYIKGMDDAKKFRNEINKIDEKDVLKKKLEEYLESLR